MKFYEVLKSVMRGNKAYRKGWNGKNMFIYLENGAVIPKSKVTNDTLRFSLSGKEVTINPHIDLKNSKGELQVGWSPSQEDLLADDWQDFYFQNKDKPIDTIHAIHGGFSYPESKEEMHNSILDRIQYLFEESDIMETSRNDIGMPLNEALVVAISNWDKGNIRYTLVTLSKDSPLENSNNAGVISIDDIAEYIYDKGNVGSTNRFRDFLNNPERVIYEIVKDKVNNF